MLRRRAIDDASSRVRKPRSSAAMVGDGNRRCVAQWSSDGQLIWWRRVCTCGDPNVLIP
jgi:hypothetical protein